MIAALSQQLDELEAYTSSAALCNPAVSQSGIGWHLEHALLTVDVILQRLTQTDPLQYKSKLSWSRLAVFATRTIPRGRAKSPRVVQPVGEITCNSLQQHLAQTRRRLETISGIGQQQYVEHPYFGHLKTKQALVFLEIHTKHHLKIIRDIMKRK